MSRIGIRPIEVPSGVTVTVDAATNVVSIKGPKGELNQPISRLLTVKQEDGKLMLERPNNLREARSQHGLARTLLFNMVEGVTKGHSKQLDVIGVGYRATMQGSNLLLNMGYSHPVTVNAPAGITLEVKADEKARTTSITVSGIDKALVGQVAADIRKVRKPEPYKGKGIRYRGEVIKLKAGKRASAKK
ncbi:MAG: 50S ribosomal protein L6 [Armatimonadetes bacterium]|nr:50S ribosomal protein L6 [Armatimonadota bacterium]MBS1700119.1 50S ribosomal protein L6 [Armatimonadota bacterium]MBS1726739.1 50S ribosomal protein L6 [Armatimonadota bacterium]